MARRLVVLLVAATLSLSTPLYGHHSAAATYFEGKMQTIEGALVQFLFRNPHSFVHVETKDANGEVTRWAVEWVSGGELAKYGVTRETLRPGDHVIVTGNPPRNADEHRLRMKTMTRPWDGWKWAGTVD
jgi:hypothetical protein